jgi:hypothetical protein
MGLREAAMPFDWCVIPITGVITHIKEDFANFMVTENLCFLPPAPRKLMINELTGETKKDIITPVIDTHSRTLYPHDFSQSGIFDLDDVQEKYAKRIERFREWMNSGEQIVFVVTIATLQPFQKEQYDMAHVNSVNNTNDWLVEFKKAVRTTYPNAKFKVKRLSEIG